MWLWWEMWWFVVLRKGWERERRETRKKKFESKKKVFPRRLHVFWECKSASIAGENTNWVKVTNFRRVIRVFWKEGLFLSEKVDFEDIADCVPENEYFSRCLGNKTCIVNIMRKSQSGRKYHLIFWGVWDYYYLKTVSTKRVKFRIFA